MKFSKAMEKFFEQLSEVAKEKRFQVDLRPFMKRQINTCDTDSCPMAAVASKKLGRRVGNGHFGTFQEELGLTQHEIELIAGAADGAPGSIRTRLLQAVGLSEREASSV